MRKLKAAKHKSLIVDEFLRQVHAFEPKEEPEIVAERVVKEAMKGLFKPGWLSNHRVA